jgi:hypothetical protein
MRVHFQVNAWRAAAFCPPAGPPRRIAVLRHLRMPRACKYFDPALPYLMERLRDFRPDAVAGSYDQLMELSGLTIDSAVIIFTATDSNPLTAVQRDLLWNTFGVPKFEQLLASDGSLMATECEAHEGLHVVAHSGLFGPTSVTDARCNCGQTIPRILRPLTALAAAGC